MHRGIDTGAAGEIPQQGALHAVYNLLVYLPARSE
jgi:hypothetical protein